MGFKCPDCGSTLFHIENNDDEYVIKCYKTKSCAWSVNTKKV